MEIVSGLKEGDSVVSGSFSVITRTLKDGAKVRLQPANATMEPRIVEANRCKVQGVVIGVLFAALPRELAPMEDRGRIWVRATGSEGVSYEYMQAFMDDVTSATAQLVPESDVMMTQVPGVGGGPGVQGAVNSGFIRVFLNDKSDQDYAPTKDAARALFGEQGNDDGDQRHGRISGGGEQGVQVRPVEMRTRVGLASGGDVRVSRHLA